MAIAILMYKIKTKKKTPNYIHDLFGVRLHNSRDADLFNIPSYNTVAYGKKSSYYGAKLRSNISPHIKAKTSPSTFKSSLVE